MEPRLQVVKGVSEGALKTARKEQPREPQCEEGHQKACESCCCGGGGGGGGGGGSRGSKEAQLSDSGSMVPQLSDLQLWMHLGYPAPL